MSPPGLARLRTLGRGLAIRSLAATDAVGPIRRGLTSGLTIFTFHDVGDYPTPYQDRYRLTTPIDVFCRQIDWVTSRYRVIHPDRLLDPDAVVEDGDAVLTFDDGWKGIFRHALPILASLGLPSITFLNMGAIDGDVDVAATLAFRSASVGAAAFPPWPTPYTATDGPPPAGELLAFQGRYADRAAVWEWADSPLVRYGNHLHHHWHAASLADDDFTADYERNESCLAGFAATVPLFAFPFGRPVEHFDQRQVELATRLGARRVFTSVPASNPIPLAVLLDRVSLSANEVDASTCWYAAHHRQLRRRVGR